MEIKELIKQAHENALSKGFYPDGEKKNIGELLMLVVSELGEALEAHRAGTFPLYEMFQSEIDSGIDFRTAFKNHIKDTLQDELSDAVIRICDMCGYLNIDLEKHIELKMKYNTTREYKHGKSY